MTFKNQNMTCLLMRCKAACRRAYFDL